MSELTDGYHEVVNADGNISIMQNGREHPTTSPDGVEDYTAPLPPELFTSGEIARLKDWREGISAKLAKIDPDPNSFIHDWQTMTPRERVKLLATSAAILGGAYIAIEFIAHAYS